MHQIELYPTHRISNKPARGFEKKYSPELNQRRKMEFWDEVHTWGRQQVKTTMGFINALTYSMAQEVGAIQLNPNGRKFAICKRIERLCRYGCRQLYTTIKGITQYVADWWGGVKSDDRRSIRRVRDTLAKMGLLKFKPLNFQERSWQTFFDIDFGGLLMLYGLLESLLLEKFFCDFEKDLPRHKGSLVRGFHNICKKMLGTFRRVKEPEEPGEQPETVELATPKLFVPVYYLGGLELDANFCDRVGVFHEECFLSVSQFAKQRWFDSVDHHPQCDLPY